MKSLILTAIAEIIFLFSFTEATTIQVTVDVDTIQEGIDLAAGGNGTQRNCRPVQHLVRQNPHNYS